jgi:hypothetical protein
MKKGRPQKPSGNVRDLTSQTIGYLKIIRYIESRLSRGSMTAFWLCECKCGNFIEKSSYYLLRPNRGIRSCGCYRADWMKEIFDSNIEKMDSCWIWKGSFNRGGYGKIGMKALAHRRSYEYYKGVIPEGMCVLHSCDIRKCVNPDHLFLGTLGDNNRDRTIKGRSVRGPFSRNSVVTEEMVLEIRKLRICGNEYRTIADKFSIKWDLVRKICKNVVWKHVALGEESKAYISPANGYKKSEPL